MRKPSTALATPSRDHLSFPSKPTPKPSLPSAPTPPPVRLRSHQRLRPSSLIRIRNQTYPHLPHTLTQQLPTPPFLPPFSHQNAPSYRVIASGHPSHIPKIKSVPQPKSKNPARRILHPARQLTCHVVSFTAPSGRVEEHLFRNGSDSEDEGVLRSVCDLLFFWPGGYDVSHLYQRRRTLSRSKEQKPCSVQKARLLRFAN